MEIQFPSSQQWIVTNGDPLSGYEFYGPFDDVNDATAWSESNLDPDWYVAKLRKP